KYTKGVGKLVKKGRQSLAWIDFPKSFHFLERPILKQLRLFEVFEPNMVSAQPSRSKPQKKLAVW
ncbi:hypothetical protein K1I73_10285, partial [Streptococcus gordonii]|nr:hypothetical protein [Streptococcus gordonii]